MNFFNSKITVSITIAICMLLPILKFQHYNSETVVDTIENATEKLKNDKLGLLEDVWDWGKKKLFDDENEAVRPLKNSEKIMNTIYTGFNFGLSVIGASKETYNNAKFKLYNPSLISSSIIFLLLLIQFFLNFSSKLRVRLLGFTGLLCLLGLVVIIGSSSYEEITEPLIKGWLPFMVLQGCIIVFTARSARKKDLHYKIEQKPIKFEEL